MSARKTKNLLGMVSLILISFFYHGCIPKQPVRTTVEHPNSDSVVKAFFAKAKALEKSGNYKEAGKIYSMIANQYDQTDYRKQSVWKVIVLNLHPNNDEINVEAAQDWLKIYATFGLTQQEQENAMLFTALIHQMQFIAEQKDTLAGQIETYKKNNKALKRKLKNARIKEEQAKQKLGQLENYEAALFELEYRFSALRKQLEKMKEVDVQMHNTKKNVDGTPVKTE